VPTQSVEARFEPLDAPPVRPALQIRGRVGDSGFFATGFRQITVETILGHRSSLNENGPIMEPPPSSG
jgi:hypothetical protein